MARSYDKLKKLMIDMKMNNTQLRQASKITTNAMAKIWRDEPVSIETLEKICYALNCNIEDIFIIFSCLNKPFFICNLWVCIVEGEG